MSFLALHAVIPKTSIDSFQVNRLLVSTDSRTKVPVRGTSAMVRRDMIQERPWQNAASVSLIRRSRDLVQVCVLYAVGVHRYHLPAARNATVPQPPSSAGSPEVI